MPRPRKHEIRPPMVYARPNPNEENVANGRPQEVDEGDTPMSLDGDPLPLVFDNEHSFDCAAEDYNSIAQIVMFISMFTTLVFSLSRSSSDTLLRLLKCLVDAVLELSGAASNVSAERLVDDIPKDSRTVRSRYGLGGGTTVYAVCPRCHCTYRPRKDPKSNGVAYPQVCSSTAESPETPCNTKLLSGDQENTPIKTFTYHSVTHFIGNLLSRASVEKFIDKSCDELRLSPARSFPETHGPFEAEFLRLLEGHQPGVLFIERGGEVRLAFCLNVDFFNVEGVKSGAATVTCGIISLACLNLPADIRYKDENMFLAGIIPGPEEPSNTEINSYLAPLIDEFATLWNPGVHLSRTASTPHGRLARAVIALIVCDLPAGRKVAGLMSHSSRDFMCSRCNCTKKLIGNVDTNFVLRGVETLRLQATAWRDAKTDSDRDNITSTYGVRWSELWRLPYWNPITQLVVDPMHCLLLGLVNNHFTNVFPMSMKLAESTSQTQPFQYEFKKVPPQTSCVLVAGTAYAIRDNEIQDVDDIHRMLTKAINVNDAEVEWTRLRSRLEKKHKISLMFVTDSLGLNASIPMDSGETVTKQCYADVLTTWRFNMPLCSTFKLTTLGLMRHVQRVLKDTSRPSFVRSVPSDFGTSRAGKIKADEWRTLCTVFIPLALISYCFLSGELKDAAFQQQFKEVTDHTMDLVQAVKVVFQKSIGTSEIESYNRHIKSYVKRLKTVHPGAKFVPNMHMATHITDYLPLFGSVYSWWTNPFERLINKLQGVKSNNKTGESAILVVYATCPDDQILGELESTMLNYFLAASRLKQRLARGGCPPAVEACLDIIDEAFDSETVKFGKRLWDGRMELPERTNATPEALLLLNSCLDKLMSRCRWNGVQYCARKRHEGNSQICFRSGNDRLAGFIEYIVVGDSPMFIVRRLSLFDAKEDPFSKFKDAVMALFFEPPDQPLEVVNCNEVLGHFAAYKIGGKYAVLPLCRV